MGQPLSPQTCSTQRHSFCQKPPSANSTVSFAKHFSCPRCHFCSSSTNFLFLFLISSSAWSAPDRWWVQKHNHPFGSQHHDALVTAWHVHSLGSPFPHLLFAYRADSTSVQHRHMGARAACGQKGEPQTSLENAWRCSLPLSSVASTQTRGENTSKPFLFF